MTEQTSNSGAATGSSGGSSQKRKAAVFPHSELTRSIIGGLFDVHSELGAGFLERVYANGLAVVLRARGLRVEREVPYEIHFRGKIIGRYVADMVVESAVVVEIKAAESIERTHRAQLLNYLRASDLQVGLVLSFGESAQFKRMINTTRRTPRSR